ncbi:unnamed protein product [Brassica rapa subsp. narinosa]
MWSSSSLRGFPWTLCLDSSLYPRTGNLQSIPDVPNKDNLSIVGNHESDIVVVNPATRWHQSFPLSNVQHFSIEKYNKCEFAYPLIPRLGFGKDKVTGTYKPVYLYNSHDFKLGNVTTCEVFDFRTNAWRYVVPSSPYRIFGHYEPVYLDGSLYDLIKEETEHHHVHPRRSFVCVRESLAHPRDMVVRWRQQDVDENVFYKSHQKCFFVRGK